MDYKKLANAIIDNYCETNGVRQCIWWLMGFGLTEKELLELSFDKDDIEKTKGVLFK